MSEWQDFLVGKTLTSIEQISGPKGEDYIRFHFGDTFYEFLSHFAPSEHKVFLAEEALRKIKDECYDSAFANSIAEQALEEMEKF